MFCLFWLHIKLWKQVYLRDLLHYHQPTRTLRSSSQLFHQPATRINFQSKAFSITVHGTSCLELSASSYKKFRYHQHFQGTSENWSVRCCAHTTRSNISSASGAFYSNSRHTVPPIKVFDILHCIWRFFWLWRRSSKQVRMYYVPETSGCYCICAGQTLGVHSPEWQHGSTFSSFLHEKTSWPPSWTYDVLSKIGLHQWIEVAPTRRTTTRWVSL